MKHAELVTTDFADARAYAQSYVGSGSSARFFRARLREILNLIESAEGGKLLDVGCGPGILVSQLAGTRFEPYGVDQSPAMIAEAKLVAPAHATNLTVGRAENLPYSDNYFDVVVALGVLEYLPRVEDGLAELYRVAKPGSPIIVSMLNKWSFRRCWDNTANRLWRAFRRRWELSVPAQSWLRRFPPTHSHLYRLSERSLRQSMTACQLRPEKTVYYYDLNVVPPPFDSANPERTSALNQWFELYVGRRLAWLTHSGFLIIARK